MLCWQQVRMQLVSRHFLNAKYYLQCVFHCFQPLQQQWDIVFCLTAYKTGVSSGGTTAHHTLQAPNGADARHEWLACELLVLESTLMVLQKGLHAVAG